MRQAELNREVARATGETVATIKRIGFLIADPDEPISDPNSPQLGGRVIDWDEFDLCRAGHEEEVNELFTLC